MIGILLVSHGVLGEALIGCASHVFGTRPERLEAATVSACDDPVEAARRIRVQIDRLDAGQGVLVLADIFGATPSNIVCRLLDPGRVEGLSGANLPMLVRALTYRESPMDTLIAKALSGGIEGVFHISQEVCHVAG